MENIMIAIHTKYLAETNTWRIKMKVYDNQDELKAAYHAGNCFVVTYRTIYEIKWCHGISGYIKQKVFTHYGQLPLIGKGRFIFTNGRHVETLMA